LLTAYSLGLGIPFLLTALTLDSAQGLFRRIKRQMRTIELVAGAFLIFVGFTIATGRLQQWSLALSTDFADFSYQLEECVTDLFHGDVALSGFPACVRDDAAADDTQEEVAPEATPEPSTSAALQNFDGPSVDAIAESSLPVGLGEGERAPDFEAQTLSGETIRLSDYRGQVVILNFWFTTCGPCLREMPDLQAAYDAYGEDGFTVLAINRQDPADEVRAFMDDLALSLPVVMDPDGSLQRRFNIAGYPSSYVLDPQGVIIDANYRGALTPDQIEALIREAAS
jgi:peroxiredoxin